jgi:hypothetical protein
MLWLTSFMSRYKIMERALCGTLCILDIGVCISFMLFGAINTPRGLFIFGDILGTMPLASCYDIWSVISPPHMFRILFLWVTLVVATTWILYPDLWSGFWNSRSLV